ncbi:neurotrypsin, partial [Biomphalaria glabrata]
CNETHFGSSCEAECSSQCSQSVCDSETGSCVTCIPGYIGEFCNISCNETHFGQNCTEKCSSQCNETVCDSKTGRCMACIPGFEGHFCDIRSDIQESSVAIGVGVGVGAAVVLLVVIAVVLYKRRVQQAKQKSEAGVENVVKSEEVDHYDKVQPEDTSKVEYQKCLNESIYENIPREMLYETISFIEK